ncbi:hypothetical protein QBC37DRAFT_421412 [Rhypophila decipiens]|uniref:Zn(2)-C6 fungal-type domain-containing protein n=1 Tax=Rhypophila decipiens TaxID=261697 RepID=A0AAN6YAE7_9PEZI|nr:hypothetical protein QBC37DRAFT_421412 [Rhypophila decipiens]
MSRFQRQPICLQPIAPRPPENPSHDPAQPGAARKRTRASKPKVRTGCKTCKIRHLKCDEAKPACRQCSKVRMVCDGYDHHRSPSSGESPSPVPSLSPSRTKYSTHDIPYLDFFRYQLIDDFAGSSCTDFWSRVVLCEAMTSDSVRHITLAIAALSKAISESPSDINKPSPLSPWTEKSVINTTHAVALRHYVKALSLFQHQHLNNGIQSPRAVLIMTLLLITFELFFQNEKAVLSTYDQKRKKEDDLSDIEHMLPFLSITGGWTPFLKTQQANLSIWDTSPLAENVPLLHHYSTPMQLQTSWGRFFLRATAFTGQALMAIVQPHHDGETLRRWEDQQETYLAQLVQWRAVIGSALTNHLLQQQQTTALQVMRLHCQMLEIGVLCCLDKTDMLWDAYDSAFDVLVGDCLTLALTSRKSNKTKLYGKWTMQMGILSTLGPAIAKCRNHDIRMRALEMARRMPWREGAWDAEAELFGKLGAVLLEERGRDLSTGIVRAENRWTWVDGSWDVAESKLVGRYVRSVPDEVTGQPVFQTLELGLDKLPDICREVGCVVDHAVECRALEY